MSFQAITDINNNPQLLQQIQISNTVKDSPINSSSTSFSEMLSSMQSETKVDQKPVIDEKPASLPDDKPVEKTDKTEKSEKSEKTDKSEENSKVKENSAEEKTEKVETKSEEKNVKEVKENISEDTEKKLTSKDFARLNQLTEKDESNEETVLNTGIVAENVKTEIKNQNIEEQKVEVKTDEVQMEANNALQLASAQQMENETSEFDFSNESKNQKETSFDKEAKITVQDLRTEASEEIKLDEKSDLRITEVKQTSENSAQITIDLNQNANADVLSLNTQSAAADGSNFQAMLNNQIQNNAPEFVKAGNLVLKDNNQGTIDLVLHPDDLGNVKIHLSLDGKTISGQITVNSKEALQVFKDNAETLREAFIKEGFDGASFDVAFNNGGSSNQNFGFEQQNDGTNLLGKRVYGSSAEAVGSNGETGYLNDEDYSNYSVNIVA